METLYYVKPREEELGPLTFAQLRSMWSRGEINVKTPFRYEEEETWQPLAILRRDLETGGPPPIQQIPPPLPLGNQAPAKPSPKGTNVGGCGCFAALLIGIVVILFSIRGPSPEEEAAAAKRQRDHDASISTLLRQEVANANTPQEKRRALEKLLKHEPGNLDVQTALKNLPADKQSKQGQSGTQSISQASKTEEPTQKVSLITFEEIDEYFFESNYTSLQKDERWKAYKGKPIRWTGKVSSISKGLFGGLSVQIKMKRSTLTSDVILDVSDEQREVALQYKEGDTVTFSGTLNDWGQLIGISIKDARLE